ncbi:MAG: DUF2282 domain-containing protein [Deltaproteobacteria bacterium]|nr:DUF2282 domain-containing protein [Deltaproteobacteria bacterium]MBW2363153.1 DUF2282 domain-containing protein [Deltaproteobacteria bacterium]
MNEDEKTTARSIARNALAGVLALGVSSLLAGAASAAPDWSEGLEKIEKCGGVAKAGKNDCGAKGHNCAGMAATDNIPDEWVFTPVGVCEKIGGKVLKTKKL